MCIPRSVICLCHVIDLQTLNFRDAARLFKATLLDMRLRNSIVFATHDTEPFLNVHRAQHVSCIVEFGMRSGTWRQGRMKLGCTYESLLDIDC
jgi:hypothetical protein